MKIVLIEQDDVLAKRIIVALEMALPCKVVNVKSAKDGLTIVESSKEAELVIADFATVDGDSRSVYNHIKEKKLNIPYIWLTYKTLEDLKYYDDIEGFEKDHPGNGYIPKFMCFDILESTVKKSIGIRSKFNPNSPQDYNVVLEAERKQGAVDASNAKNSTTAASVIEYPLVKDYVRIHVKRFFFRNNNEFDIYSFTASGKIDKILDKNSATASDILKCRRSYSAFYLKTSAYMKYLGTYLETARKNISSENNNVEETVTTQIQLLSIIHDCLHQNIDKKIIFPLIRMLTNSVYDVHQKVVSYWPVYNTIMKGKDYLLEKSLVMAYFGVGVANNLDERDNDLPRNFICAALFHDLGITYNENLWDKKSLKDADVISLNENDKNIFKDHVKMSTDILNGCDEMNTRVVDMIHAHHEMVGGGGFPKGHNENEISDLGAAFKAVEVFTDNLLHHVGKPDQMLMDNIISILHEKYDKGNFKKGVDAALNVMTILIDEM